MAKLNFNASAVEMPARTFGPLPAGEYEMMVIKSDNKVIKAGNGHYLELEMQVISGAHSGRRHWERLNLDNPSKKTVEIAEEQLARLCAALGLAQIEDSEELHDRPFIARVVIDKKDPTSNRIYDFMPAEGAASAPATAVAVKPAAVAAPAKSSRPWG